MSVKIRKANDADFSTILSLIKEFSVFQNTPEKVTITLEQIMEDKSFFQCLVAETDNNEIVGFATYFLAYYSWTGRALYLDDLYVTKAFRKRGIGKALLVSVIDYAKEARCKKVRWQVSKWNTKAIQFYKKVGATVDETEINCDYTL